MRNILLLLLFSIPCHSFGIVIRHDIPNSQYNVEEPPEYLIDMPHEGHGVLIDESWILTVAHGIFYDYEGAELEISGNTHSIESVHIHPGYSEPPEEFLSGDSKRLMEFLANRSDIALLKLSEPVTNRQPIRLYLENGAVGKTMTIYGRGGTGNGISGEDQNSKADRILRYCLNVVGSVQGHWIVYEFDSPESGLPLEGMHGSGDSGGPSVIYIGSEPYLLGLSSWQYFEGELSNMKAGIYGTQAFQVRVSAFSQWIEEIINAR